MLADGRRVLALKVRAVPAGGAANAALFRLVAQAFGVGRNCVSLRSGGKSRLKRVHIAGDGRILAAIAAGLERQQETKV